MKRTTLAGGLVASYFLDYGKELLRQHYERQHSDARLATGATR
jgi:hypothetical protein